MAGEREVKAKIRADGKDLDPDLNRANKKMKTWAAKTGRDIHKSMSRAFGTMGDILGIGGIASIAIAGRSVMEFEKRLTRLQMSSGLARGGMIKLKSSMFALAKDAGLDVEDVLGGAEKYQELTGDLKGYTVAMNALGHVSAATGASMSDVSSTAAALSQNLGVLPEEMGAAFDTLSYQGDRGAIELKNLAALAADITPQFSQFGTKGLEGVRELGALMQVTRHGFGSAEKTVTGLTNLMSTLTAKAKGLRKYGIHVVDPKSGKMNDLRKIIDQISKSKLASKPLLMRAVMRDKEAIAALIPLLADGRKEYDMLTDASKSAGSVQQKFAIWQQSAAKKMMSAQAKLAEFFNDKLAGHIDTAANALSKVVDALNLIGRHPMLAIGAWAAWKAAGGIIDNVVKKMEYAENLKSGGGRRGGRGGGGKGAPGGVGAGTKLEAGIAAFAVGYEIGTYLDQATGASKKISDTMLKIAGKFDSTYEALVARDAIMQGKIKARMESAQQRAAGGASVIETTNTQARLQGAADTRADELQRLEDHMRSRGTVVQRALAGKLNGKRSLLDALPVSMEQQMIEQQRAKVGEMDRRAAAMPVMGGMFLNRAAGTDAETVGGVDPQVAAELAVQVAGKVMQGKMTMREGDAALLVELRKISSHLAGTDPGALGNRTGM